MRYYRVARRYATALLHSAKNEAQLKEIAHDAEMIGETVRENRELQLALASPVIQREKKKKILEKLFENRIGPMMINFLNLITDKDREGELLEIIEEFMRLLDETRGIVRVEVTSAIELTNSERNELQKHLETYTGKKVVPSFRLNPSILGGFLIHLNDRVIDASLVHQLELLRTRFLEGAYAGRES